MAAVPTVVQTNDEKAKYQYSKVSLSLENCILPPDKLSPSPSQLDGLDPEAEVELRILGCELIQISGILLRLPQVAMATGQVLFQRFFYSKSFVRQAMEVVAMACITLASKIEEAPRRIRDVVNVFHHIKQVKSGKTIQPLILDQNYINQKNQVIKAERRVLKELGFCVHVKHPHKIIVTLLEVLKVNNKKLMQTAWNYMNDSLRTEVFVRFHPETIACGCIHLSARLLQIPLPNNPFWYLVFGVSEQDINEVSHSILSLYTRRKPDPDRLEKLVEDLRKTHNDAKMRAKGLNAINNVLNSSSPSTQNSPRNGTKSPGNDNKKDRSDKHHNDTSPKYHKESNHRKRRSPSPSEDGYQSPKRVKSSSSGSGTTSRSPSPRRKHKTPPRGFKDSSSHRSRSRSRTTTKKSKHSGNSTRPSATHPPKRKHSLSPIIPPSPHKKPTSSSYKSTSKSHANRPRSKSPSQVPSKSQDRNHSSKSHKSRRGPRNAKENHHSKKRR